MKTYIKNIIKIFLGKTPFYPIHMGFCLRRLYFFKTIKRINMSHINKVLDAWYRSCEGAFFVRTLEDCKEVLNEIINGCQISSPRVKAFVNSINKVSIKVQLGLIRFEDDRVIPQDNNIKNLSKYIIRMSRM